MLANIKSTYFAKVIFSFINEKLKLILVKYSKKLQNQIPNYSTYFTTIYH